MTQEYRKVMIKEAYVSFEIAKLLKEKGFKEEVTNYYDSGGNFVESGYKFNYNFQTVDHSAPTHQMAMTWLREEKGIAIIPIISSILDNEKFLWNVNITIAKTGETYTQGWTYESYESIVEEALKYTLENLV